MNVKKRSPLDSILIALPVLTLAWSAFTYFDIEAKKQKQIAFENYHETIKSLLADGEKTIQSAAIYELRKYPEYCDFSLRVLRDVEKDWKKDFLATEIKLSIDHLSQSCKE